MNAWMDGWTARQTTLAGHNMIIFMLKCFTAEQMREVWSCKVDMTSEIFTGLHYTYFKDS
jgi:allantoicase